MFRGKTNDIKKTRHLNLILVITLLAFVISGCGSSGDGGGNTNAATDVREITVPFGDVVLDHVSDQPVLLNNNGSTTLNIGQIDLVNSLTPPFSIIEDNCSGISLTSSGSCMLQFRFAPTQEQGAYSDTFFIPSNDPSRDIGVVYLNGEALALNVSINQAVKDCPNSTIKLYMTIANRFDDPELLVPQADVSLFENGNQLLNFRFSNSVSSNLSVVLALDYSGSTEAVIEEIEKAAFVFIENLELDSGTDEAAIIKFSRTAQPAQVSFTDNQLSLEAQMNTPFTGDRTGTILFDVVAQSAKETATFARNDRQAIVVISDGRDFYSETSLREAIDIALENGVPVFTIGIGNVNVARMQPLADETGGQFFIVDNSSELTGIYEKISSILTNQYVIEYTTSPSGGGPISIDVQVDYDVQGDILNGRDAKDVPGC